MDKDVSTLVASEETKTFCIVEPLDLPLVLSHVKPPFGDAKLLPQVCLEVCPE